MDEQLKQLIEQAKELAGEGLSIHQILDTIIDRINEQSRSTQRWQELRFGAIQMANDRIPMIFKKGEEVDIENVLGVTQEIAEEYMNYFMTGNMKITQGPLNEEVFLGWVESLPENITLDAVLRAITYNQTGHSRTQAAYLLGLATIQMSQQDQLFNKAEVHHQLEQIVKGQLDE